VCEEILSGGNTAARRLDELAEFTLERGRAGGRAELFGHIDLYRTDADYIRRA
jgi:hypothetical protein